MLSVTKNIGVCTALHGVLASLGVTPSSVHVGDGCFTAGSLGRATHVKWMTPDSASLLSTVDALAMVEDSVGSGEGGSRSNRFARIPLNRGPGKQAARRISPSTLIARESLLRLMLAVR